MHVLLQNDISDDLLHPIYYLNQTTYCSNGLQVLATVGALKKFRIYLLGFPFNVVTVCQGFSQMITKRELSMRRTIEWNPDTSVVCRTFVRRNLRSEISISVPELPEVSKRYP